MLILLFGGSSKLRSKPFTPWLWGSNQIEHMFSEWRSFEHGKHDVELLLSSVSRDAGHEDFDEPHALKAQGRRGDRENLVNNKL